MKIELIWETVKGFPAWIGALLATTTPNQAVGIITTIYVVTQFFYLLRKWYWEEKDRAARERGVQEEWP